MYYCYLKIYKTIDIYTTLVYYITSALILYMGEDEKMSQFDDNIPIYVQISNMIKGEIASGKLKQGDKLPSIRDMSNRLKVNPNTIQRVYGELEREGITFTQRGMGTFITQDKKKIKDLRREMAETEIKSFISTMGDLGFTDVEIMDLIEFYMERG